MKATIFTRLVLIKTNIQKSICLLFVLIILLSSPFLSFAQIDSSSFVFEGKIRNYLVFLPQNYDGLIKMPVVLNLHGYTLDARQQLNYSRMNEIADTSGFIVVYPNAVDKTWNSGIHDGHASNPNINDVGFIDALIDTLGKHYSFDLDKIYSCGFSNGGFMSYKLACQLSNKIAAIASVAGLLSYTTASGCNCNHSMPVLQIHGTSDLIVPYNGENGWHSVEETLHHWIIFNSCKKCDTTLLTDIDTLDGCTVEKIIYTSSNNCKVDFYKVINGGHTWPGGDKQYLHLSWGDIGNTNGDFNASTAIWNFLKTYKLSDFSKVNEVIEHHIDFLLLQNYPNPFNPSTTISYKLATNGHVSLKIFDVLGNEIAVLVNEKKPSGVYEVTWNAKNLSSGVYFYQVKTENYSKSIKMLLLR